MKHIIYNDEILGYIRDSESDILTDLVKVGDLIRSEDNAYTSIDSENQLQFFKEHCFDIKNKNEKGLDVKAILTMQDGQFKEVMYRCVSRENGEDKMIWRLC